MSFGIAPGEAVVARVSRAIPSERYSLAAETPEERRARVHRDYSREYSAWIHSIEEQAEAGNKSAIAELNELKLSSKASGINLLVPLRYDRPARRKYGEDEDEFGDPADQAVDPVDPREAIVDFESVDGSELQQLCDHFGASLVWATAIKNGAQPDLMQMGARWLAIFTVLRPQLIGEMNLRAASALTPGLRGILNGRDPLETGRFFRKPLAWVRKCTSLLQLGKRGYSATYVLRGDLINSATCAAIGGLDNKSRQAANKPIQEFRDTFGGIKSLPMRGKETRKRCKKAQEKN